jgi:hypothetical protein
MTRIKVNACGKYGYFTKKDAKAKLEASEWGKKKKRCRSIYKCNNCGMYHLTSQVYQKK